MPRREQAGERYPSGGLRPERFGPTLVRQMVDAAEAGIINKSFGTPIGRLRLEGKLDDAHVSAALHFGLFFGFYDRAFGNSSRSARSPGYQIGRGGEGSEWRCRDCTGTCTTQEKECDVRGRLSAEHDGLQSLVTTAEWRAIYDATILNQYPAYFERGDLRTGLMRLAVHYGYVVERGVSAAVRETVAA